MANQASIWLSLHASRYLELHHRLHSPHLPDQIGLERSRLIELEEKANSLQGKIGTQRKAMGGVNAAREANIQVLILTLVHSITTTAVTSIIVATVAMDIIAKLPTTIIA